MLRSAIVENLFIIGYFLILTTYINDMFYILWVTNLFGST